MTILGIVADHPWYFTWSWFCELCLGAKFQFLSSCSYSSAQNTYRQTESCKTSKNDQTLKYLYNIWREKSFYILYHIWLKSRLLKAKYIYEAIQGSGCLFSNKMFVNQDWRIIFPYFGDLVHNHLVPKQPKWDLSLYCPMCLCNIWMLP